MTNKPSTGALTGVREHNTQISGSYVASTFETNIDINALHKTYVITGNHLVALTRVFQLSSLKSLLVYAHLCTYSNSTCHQGQGCVATLDKLFTRICLSPNSITWYWSKDSDVF